MNKRLKKQQKKDLQTFFGKPYVLVFALLLFACATIKLAFTISRESATGIWKFTLIFDTITTLLLSSSLFLFYMSSDTKAKEGAKIAAVTFIVASSLSIFTQLAFVIYIATFFEIIPTILTILCFFIPTLFQLRFSIYLMRDVFKNKIRAKGAGEYAGTKIFALVPAFLIKYMDFDVVNTTPVINVKLFLTPFESSNAMDTSYPTLAFICLIVTSGSLAAFSLLYNKFAIEYEKENTEQ